MWRVGRGRSLCASQLLCKLVSHKPLFRLLTVDQFYLVGSFFAYSAVLVSLVDTKPSPTTAHLATWIVGLILETLMLGASISLFSHEHREPDLKPPSAHKRMRMSMTNWELADVLIDFTRIVTLAALIMFYLVFVTSRNAVRAAKAASPADDGLSESTGLLTEHDEANGSARRHHNGYGSTPAANKPRDPEQAPPGWERPTTTPDRNWWEYLKGYAVFFPYLWPAKDRRLQLTVIVCFLLVLAQRGINVLVPIQSGVITDILSGEKGPARMPWGPICLYILYRFLQGSNGILGAARSVLWIPVSQYSYKELTVASFEHVHGLSLDFHLGKKTGEVLSALGKGSSINTFLEQISFQVVPMIVDLCVAVGYFLIAFDTYYALVVAIITFCYIYITIRLAQWRQDIRRDMTNSDREADGVKNDSMTSYESVKYFNAEPWEFRRYSGAVEKYLTAEYKVLFSLQCMNVSQNLIFMLGLLVACFICSYQVAAGQRNVGSFVSLISYMAQLQNPLNFFGTFYRMIQSALINSERMLELFKEKPTVVDGPHATSIFSCEGGVRFQDIQFSYDNRKPALTGLTFNCAPGTTTALVGESGGGKSTVFRLLFRFYNPKSGSIQVDGNDVQGVTIDSLRSYIGVVPQDTVLFNESLMYNLKYARQSCTDEDVFNACRAASIHEKILSFPDGYDTKVGERGLRLSGGEKQRVAIARTILKNPRIILLDEATAALDTDTEQHIQDALTHLGKGRTMLIIAHRLSTITNADQILVLHEGKVDERGSHSELLAKKGRYSSMWRKQVRAEKAAEEARVLKDRADRLRREVGDTEMSSANQSEGESDESGVHSRRQSNMGVILSAADAVDLPKDDAKSTERGDEQQQTKEDEVKASVAKGNIQGESEEAASKVAKEVAHDGVSKADDSKGVVDPKDDLKDDGKADNKDLLNASNQGSGGYKPTDHL